MQRIGLMYLLVAALLATNGVVGFTKEKPRSLKCEEPATPVQTESAPPLKVEVPKVPALSKEIRDALTTATEMELFSLSSRETEKEGFHNYEILGRVDITDEDTRTKIAEAILKGNPDGGWGASCFFPHHGLRIKSGENQYDLIICLTCGWVHVYKNGKSVRGSTIDRSPTETLNNVFKDNNIPFTLDE